MRRVPGIISKFGGIYGVALAFCANFELASQMRREWRGFAIIRYYTTGYRVSKRFASHHFMRRCYCRIENFVLADPPFDPFTPIPISCCLISFSLSIHCSNEISFL